MQSRTISNKSRPALALIVSVALGSMALTQVVAITLLLAFGRGLPGFQAVFAELSALDCVAIYGLASILLVAMKQLFCLRKTSISWFVRYIGIGSWVALLYSLSPGPKPHFDELASLAGLLLAILVLAYMLKLRREEVLK